MDPAGLTCKVLGCHTSSPMLLLWCVLQHCLGLSSSSCCHPEVAYGTCVCVLQQRNCVLCSQHTLYLRKLARHPSLRADDSLVRQQTLHCSDTVRVHVALLMMALSMPVQPQTPIPAEK
ncbi:unnamed protein product [Polarella glacialis]|uniref:Secreted protein n=1 Tax=Polarella glacialis TaxID=89957 RepID=A0A813LIS1_POLGL|nr:unnamed protein product [Polarella glacialis]